MTFEPEPDIDPRLSIRGLRKRYSWVPVLDGVDLDVAAAEVVLLAGSNGSGKTTLLRCVAGLTRHGGRIRLDGGSCGRTPAGRARLGYLPQTPGLPGWATGAELLELFARLRGTTQTLVTLPEPFLPPLNQPVETLSGGQRQRLTLAIAMLGQPRLLLLDEPAANLDEAGRDALETIIAAVRDRGASVIIAAPSPGDLGGIADRTVRLVEGRLTDQRLPADVEMAPQRAWQADAAVGRHEGELTQ